MDYGIIQLLGSLWCDVVMVDARRSDQSVSSMHDALTPLATIMKAVCESLGRNMNASNQLEVNLRGLWWHLSWSSSRTRADSGLAPVCLPSNSPLHLSRCTGLSLCVFFMLLKLCCGHNKPSGHSMYVRTILEELHCLSNFCLMLIWLHAATSGKGKRIQKWSVATTCKTIPNRGYVANCLSFLPAGCPVCTTACNIN